MPHPPYLPFALGRGPARQAERRIDRALRRPSTYPHPAGRIERIETHLSVVYLAGRYAYKRLKPVRLPFVDLARAAQRRRCALAGYRLNQRLAGPLYLGVWTLVARGRRCAFGRSARPGRHRTASPAGEYVVRMRRFDADALLSARCAHQAEALADAEALAIALARDHRQAPRCREGDAARAAAQCRSLLDEPDATVPDEAALRAWYAGELDRIEAALLRRHAEGFVRVCHGDLHLDNIVRWRQRVLMFDCIEFDERLRRIDVASDLAFALMDYCAHGRGDCAHRLLSVWLAGTGDYAALAVLPGYFVYRALVCALTARLRGEHAARARYLRIAASMAQSRRAARPRLLLCHGFSGSGKSAASSVLAGMLGAIRLSSDVERKRMAGVAQAVRLPPPAYSETAIDAVYQRLLEQAASVLASAQTAIVDASFLRRRHRAAFLALAERLGAEAAILDFDASRETLAARLRARARLARDPSDADTAVLARQCLQAEPLEPAEAALAIRFDTGCDAGAYLCRRFWQPLFAALPINGAGDSPIRAGAADPPAEHAHGAGTRRCAACGPLGVAAAQA
ncbi:kinase [Burkholderia glumae]|uniref:bifunctional aminoglycoside phosphotransferase/ATP-binding protein n=1 Tax=Burkholderia glumae TaxID=337 RepID=UPI000F5EAFDF|nr:bifunctional aminoglycoside phosphotransferase/ATP-binding protein [Burkholderia glumae]MCQ0031279.1 AAA family ATPase [Burkholderia glumae]MCQ0039701.1 AAA family ATPase [Burkholderia glumae]QJW81466.1 AAA family ATPase [Burkholderia glumae]RQZ74597.1 kinase [Burkholderia glumae]UVS87795.1 kinase [Burkholderia glumae]